MTKKSREIDCLSRLQILTGQIDDILAFLKLENLIDDGTIRKVRMSPDLAKDVQILLQELKAKDKFQLLRYEWSLLPVENISINIITDKNQKEFIYNGG